MSWREKKLNDDSITPALVKQMKTNLLVKAIPSDINDVLTRIKLGRTLYGPQESWTTHGVAHASRKTTWK